MAKKEGNHQGNGTLTVNPAEDEMRRESPGGLDSKLNLRLVFTDWPH